MDKITVGVLTVSDRCYKNEATDESGPNLIKMIADGVVEGGEFVRSELVPDTKEVIGKVLTEWSDKVDLILTTGGTGVAERDVTPEATAALLEKAIPGIAQLMFKRSSEQTPFAALSRGIAGVRGKTLIINLPGSKKASQECLEAVAGVIPHAVHLIKGNNEEVRVVHAALTEKKSSVVAMGDVAGRPRVSAYPCVEVSDAQSIVEERVNLLKREKYIEYDKALGHVLAQDIVAVHDLPPFDASLKDGYAVLSSDGTSMRTVIGVSRTGSLPDVEICSGQCVRVSTGAAIPRGADTVMQVEDTILSKKSGDLKEEEQILLKRYPRQGEDIRKRGSDFKTGNLLLSAGMYLDSAALGLVAAAGVVSFRVFDKPLVAVFSTGDELVNPHQSLGPGKVRDSNRIALLSLLREENFRAVDGGIVPDSPDDLRNALEKGFGTADVVVTTGSMSMGERDYLKEVLVSDFNAEIFFGRVLMKPGKPTSFGMVTFGGKPKLWFGLPGNPASALVTSHLFVLPALRKISGFKKIFPMSVNVDLKTRIPPEDRPQYVRAVVTYDESNNTWKAEVIGNQSSSRIGSCVNANCFVEIPKERQSYEKPVKILRAVLIGNVTLRA